MASLDIPVTTLVYHNTVMTTHAVRACGLEWSRNCFLWSLWHANDDDGWIEGVNLAIFHELLEQPPNLFKKWRASSDGETSAILWFPRRSFLRFHFLVGNVSTDLDNIIYGFMEWWADCTFAFIQARRSYDLSQWFAGCHRVQEAISESGACPS